MTIAIRPAVAADLPYLERKCWRGGEAEMRRRLTDQGTCSILALDGDRPVGQLYLRTYRPGFRSPGGLHDGAWWADLSGADDPELPARTVVLGCWHVGRLRDPAGPEREATEYQGRGIGLALLQGAIDWVRSGAAPFEAIAVKAADTESRPYLVWLGGLPRSAFAANGFRPLTQFDDPYVIAEPEAVPEPARGPAAPQPARFHLMLWRGAADRPPSDESAPRDGS